MSREVDLAAMAEHWSQALASWAIPPEILERAERDPWTFPVDRFTQRAERALAAPGGISFERAAELLREHPGAVLDVGAGAGAASLPLAPWATHLTAVDSSAEMLEAFDVGAERVGVEHSTVLGPWPEVADQVERHDVTVAHHVVYNVPDIVPFLRALDTATTQRVVLELPTHHPLTWMTPLWERFHGVSRPTAPTAGDLVEIVTALGLADVSAEYWSTRGDAGGAATAATAEDRMAQAEVVAQRLCLPSSRAAEVAEALGEVDHDQRDLVTISWTAS